MRRVIEAALVVGGLLILGACGSAGATPTVTMTTTVTVTATPSAVPATATPVVKKRTITRRRAIPFKTRRVHDPTLTKPQSTVLFRLIVSLGSAGGS
jgi:resuscitation-promoting factor RpfB